MESKGAAQAPERSRRSHSTKRPERSRRNEGAKDVLKVLSVVEVPYAAVNLLNSEQNPGVPTCRDADKKNKSACDARTAK